MTPAASATADARARSRAAPRSAPDRLVRHGRPAQRRQHGPVGREERDVRLRVPAVDRQQEVAHAANRSQLVDPDERGPEVAQPVDDRGQRVERARRPRVEQQDRAVPVRRREGERVGSHGRAGPLRLPVVEDDVGRDVPIPERRQGSQHPPVVGAREERAAEPRPRVDVRGIADGQLGGPDVGREPVDGQERQPGVVEAVVAHEVTLIGDATREHGFSLHPATLQEPRRDDPPIRHDVEQVRGDARPVGPVRVLRVERQRHPERLRRGRLAHFSTPVTTIPRVNTRWKMMNRAIGMIIVISVPAWM